MLKKKSKINKSKTTTCMYYVACDVNIHICLKASNMYVFIVIVMTRTHFHSHSDDINSVS